MQSEWPLRSEGSVPWSPPDPDVERLVPLQRCLESLRELVGITQFTLPNDLDVPSESLKLISDSAITLDVLPELVRPELDPALRCVAVLAPRMSVPEAPVNEYHCAVLGQYYVGLAWKIAPVDPEPVAKSVEH